MIYLFDFDGTIVEELNIDYSAIKAELCNLFNTKQNFSPLIDSIVNISKTEDSIRDAFDIIDKYELKSNPVINKEVLSFIIELNFHNIKVGIITRNGRKLIDTFLDNNDLTNIIDNKISSRNDAYKFLKPNKKQFEVIRENFNVYESSNYTIIGNSYHDYELAKNCECNYIDVKILKNIKNKLISNKIDPPILCPISNIIYNRKVYGENIHRFDLIRGCNRGNAITPYAEKWCNGFGVDYGYGDYISYGTINVEQIFHKSNGVDMGVVKYYLDDNKYRVVRDESIDNLNFPIDLKDLDYIFSAHALEHIPKWKETLFYWYQLLKPGGILFLYLPHESVAAWRPENTPYHVHKHTVEELKEYLQTVSFKIVEYMIGCDSEGSFYMIAEK